MSEPFSFSFAGEDIEDTPPEPPILNQPTHRAAETGALRRPSNPAFPIPGQALLPPLSHSLSSLLATLPSKIAYSTLNVTLDDGSRLSIPRREWWDVRVQLMAEEHEHDEHEAAATAEVGLSGDDIKTGVYEGGFKSWESSVDLVKVLAGRRADVAANEGVMRVLEMGCGTALPTLALLQWQLAQEATTPNIRLSLSLADYNPSVLRLVTVPNILLSWAQLRLGPSWEPEGELDIDEELLSAFGVGMEQRNIMLSFYSGAWSPEFVRLVTAMPRGKSNGAIEGAPLLVLGAETIYSPMALRSFAESLMAILEVQSRGESMALVAAKKIYFGVGGSIEDFCDAVGARQGSVEQIREEVDGVRRAVVSVQRA